MNSGIFKKVVYSLIDLYQQQLGKQVNPVHSRKSHDSGQHWYVEHYHAGAQLGIREAGYYTSHMNALYRTNGVLNIEAKFVAPKGAMPRRAALNACLDIPNP